MGQRHQFFIRTHNPLHNERLRFDDKEKAKARKIFGKGKTTVLAFYHQWLYGRSAVVNVLNILNYSNPDTISEKNPFSSEFYILNSGCRVDAYIKKVTNLLSVQSNPLHPRGIGLEDIMFLNEETPTMRTNFDECDNNDGVTIIDAISRKYCMMNIHTYDYEIEEDEYGIYRLPPMQPCSGREYAKAYYNEDDKEEGKENIRLNFEIDLELKKTSKGILTLSELSNIFPKMNLKELAICN